MKPRAGFLIGIVSLFVGAGILSYSFTLPAGQEVLFSQNSIQLDGRPYVDFQVTANIDGKYSPIVTGNVGTVGCCVDFFLVNDSSWSSWATNSSSRVAYSEVHLNATQVSLQSGESQFFVIPSNSTGYNVAFVNDEYPNNSTARVHASIILQYTPPNTVYISLAGWTTLGVGLTWLIILFLRSRVKKFTLPTEPSQL